LPLYLRVVWRFRLLVVLGFVVAIALSFLSFVRVSMDNPHFVPREREQWLSYSALMVTRQGFPWGRSAYDEQSDPARFGQLATIYARLATGDAVEQRMLAEGPIDRDHELIQAAAVKSADYSTAPPLPLIQISAFAGTGPRAHELADRATRAFLAYLTDLQAKNLIPESKRVVVDVVQSAVKPELVTGRSKTLPIVVFLTVMMAVLGLAFALENLRPRRTQAVAEEPPLAALPKASRRSA